MPGPRECCNHVRERSAGASNYRSRTRWPRAAPLYPARALTYDIVGEAKASYCSDVRKVIAERAAAAL